MSNSKTEQAAQLRRLSDFYVFSDRLSHSLRTPLSVALGVIDDLAAGITLDSQDLIDASRALRQILHTLNSLREMANPPRFHPEKIPVAHLFTEELRSAFLDCTTFAVQDTERQHLIDRALFTRALQSLFTFATYANVSDNETPSAVLTVALQDVSPECERLRITVPHARLYRQLAGARTFSDIAELDHSAEALKLLYVEAIAEIHGVHSLVSAAPSAVLHLDLLFEGASVC